MKKNVALNQSSSLSAQASQLIMKVFKYNEGSGNKVPMKV